MQSDADGRGVKNGRRQVQNGECYTTEEVMAMLKNS